MLRRSDPRAARRRRRRQRGQASVELVAVLPLVLIAVLGAGQAVLAGYALWSAGAAARAGARAEHVGGDPHVAARSALPRPLRSRSRIETGRSVEVTVEAPALIPGVRSVRISASSRLDPAAADG